MIDYIEVEPSGLNITENTISYVRFLAAYTDVVMNVAWILTEEIETVADVYIYETGTTYCTVAIDTQLLELVEEHGSFNVKLIADSEEIETTYYYSIDPSSSGGSDTGSTGNTGVTEVFTFNPETIVFENDASYMVTLTHNMSNYRTNNWSYVKTNINSAYTSVAINSKSQSGCTFSITVDNFNFNTDNVLNQSLTLKQATTNGNYVSYPYNFKIVGNGYSGGTESGGTEDSGTTEVIIETNTNQLTFDYNSGKQIVRLDSINGSPLQWTWINNEYVNISKKYEAGTYCEYYIQPKVINTSQYVYHTSVTLRAIFANETIDIQIPITILNYIVIPVWKDEYFVFPSEYGDIVDYKINIGNETIYSGKVMKYPDAEDVSINITKMIRSYLNSEINNISTTKIQNYIKEFSIIVDDKVIGRYNIYNDWSYTDNVYKLWNQPIKSEVGVGQLLPISIMNIDNSDVVTLTEEVIRNGNVVSTMISSYAPKQMFLKVSNLSNLMGGDIYRVKVDNEILNYKVIDCKDYCLYFTNSYGAFDSMLVKGNSKQTDKINSQYYNKFFNNTLTDFEKKKYINIIKTEYVLYTDYFDDEQQSKFHNLLESVEVYLHDLKNNIILPVNITNTNCEYKTFTNNGRQKFNNTINVELSQEKIRQ